MSEEIVWTRSQQVNALNAIEIIKASRSVDLPAFNEAAATAAVANLVPGDKTDQDFGEVAPDIITGLVNVGALITQHFSEYSGVSFEQLLSNLTEGLRAMPVAED